MIKQGKTTINTGAAQAMVTTAEAPEAPEAPEDNFKVSSFLDKLLLELQPEQPELWQPELP